MCRKRIPIRAATPVSPASLKPAEVDFDYGIPDLGSVPLTAWSWALSEATRTLPTAELGDEEPAGSRHLREVVTAYHRRVRSGCAVAEDAVIRGWVSSSRRWHSAASSKSR
jgi:GntR family transcriptional regulator / MocR family aminotransferase